jgi:hypothetical protein
MQPERADPASSSPVLDSRRRPTRPVMRFVDTSHKRGGAVDCRWLAIFEDRHGPDACKRLIAELRQPCVTFAEIGKRLGVTRERVRQWQIVLLPEAPRGHERRRLCAISRWRRRLLEDRLFRDFYRHARPYVNPGQIELIKATDGYRTRSIRIGRRIVMLKDALELKDAHGSARARLRSSARTYLLASYRGTADVLYYQLTPDDYLLLPARVLPGAGTTFVDQPGSRYHVFKNTFEALMRPARGPAGRANGRLGSPPTRRPPA